MLRAAAKVEELTLALARDDQGKVRQVADGLIKQYPTSPYADQAQLVLARLSVDSGKLADAIAPLTQVMTDSKDAELRHIARLRLARGLTAAGKPDDAIKTLAEDAWGAFASQAAPGVGAGRRGRRRIRRLAQGRGSRGGSGNGQTGLGQETEATVVGGPRGGLRDGDLGFQQGYGHCSGRRERPGALARACQF